MPGDTETSKRIPIPWTAPDEDQDEEDYADGFADGIIKLLNDARTEQGLPPLDP